MQSHQTSSQKGEDTKKGREQQVRGDQVSQMLPLPQNPKGSLGENARARKDEASGTEDTEHACVPERTHGCRPQVSHWAELFPGLEARGTYPLYVIRQPTKP